MLRMPKTDEFKLNVFLKDGSSFLGKDLPQRPFGEREVVVAFWHEDKIRMYPMTAVEYVELVPEDN